jgi:polyisoprenoid-binding protein YceI
MSSRTSALVALMAAGFAAPTVALADDYGVDAGHSAVLFGAKHLDVAYTFGRFKDIEGTFVASGDKLEKVSLTIKTESVDTEVEKRDKHLRSPDYFDAAQFPTITFQSTKVEKAEGGWNVTGKLNLHGVEKTVTLPVQKTGEGKDPWGGYRYGILSDFRVKLSDHGIETGGAIADEVRMTVSLEGTKQ